MALCSNDGNSTNLLSFMLKDVEFTDFTIKVGDAKFLVHKNVLAAISPVVRAMLQNDLKEKQTNCMTILNFEKDTVEDMISFIYSGNLGKGPRDYKAMCDLLRASDVYDIESLKKFFIASIKSMVHDQNVMQVILQAELCNAPDLKICAVDYFLKSAKSYAASEFEEISKNRPNLLSELIEKLTTKNALKRRQETEEKISAKKIDEQEFSSAKKINVQAFSCVKNHVISCTLNSGCPCICCIWGIHRKH